METTFEKIYANEFCPAWDPLEDLSAPINKAFNYYDKGLKAIYHAEAYAFTYQQQQQLKIMACYLNTAFSNYQRIKKVNYIY